jgi:hypothetical protein
VSRDPHSYDARDSWDPAPPRPSPSRRGRPTDSRGDTRDGQTDSGRDLSISDSQSIGRLKPEETDSARAYYLKDRPYLLRESELHALGEIGRFRVVTAGDLAKYGYAGDRARFERELEHLKQRSLVTDKTIEVSRKKTLRILTLTKTGQRLLGATNRLPEDQATYHGLAKPREAKHDADLYRLYQKESARIVRDGGTPARVILDYELKRKLNRDLNELGREQDPEAKQRIAERHGLQLVEGRIPLPDLRIEYQTAEMETQHVDLELATHHYRPRGIAQKAKAGFSLYSPADDAPRLRRILNDRELTATILGL